MIPPGMRGKTRLARFLTPSDDRATSVVNLEGQRLHVPNLHEPIGLFLWADGAYEPDTLRFVLEHAGGGVFVDIGANIGVFTLPAALRARSVIAIEASPEIGEMLERNVRENGLTNVRVFKCAASDGIAKTVDFYVPPIRHFGMGSCSAQFDCTPIQIPAISSG